MAPPRPLAPDQLITCCEAAELGFSNTDELEDLTHIVGQDRAVEAIRFGVGMDKDGYNIFALGPPGTGKYSAIRQFLDGRAARMTAPPDTCYVNNFAETHKPNAIRLPAGRGIPFRHDMGKLIELVREAVPRAFESDEYRKSREELEGRVRSAHETLFQPLEEEAEANSIAVVRTPQGVALAPVKDGQVIPPEEFEALPDETKARIHAAMEALQKKLRDATAELPKVQRRARAELEQLNQGVSAFAIGPLIDDIRARYVDLPEVQGYLDEVRQDLIEHVEEFLTPGHAPSAETEAGFGPEAAREAFLDRFKVNVMVSHDEDAGAPVVYADLPNLQGLIGRIEHMARFGALTTNFTLIKPGALHRANGGYLILDAIKVLQSPFAWGELKRALKAREIRIEQPEHAFSVVSTVTLEPEPVPLDVKVVMTGERMLFYLLTRYDPEFNELFKAEADFEESWERTPKNIALFARLVATLIRHEQLKPFDADAVARVIDFASREAGDSAKMTTHMRSICDLLQEADYWAGTNGNGTVTSDNVRRAIDAKIQRADRIRDVAYEQIARETMLIDVTGEAVGQINGLSVTQLGKFPFGRPARITARVRLGRGHVVDIEREVELGGPIHSKGVLILSAFLGARFCPDVPLSLAASLVFEQSYGGIEGDSASSTELYALLSALAEAPIRQDLAVTGSVNQMGRVQAIGGANEKIEGFFDICSQAPGGLSGEQGVLIPEANVKHLMLRDDVVVAVTAGKFHVWPIAHVDEGIELLTGIPAGERGPDGTYPPDTINGRADARLRGFAEAARRFARTGGTDGDEEPGV
jgi:lon-related putative ATP-dependent protease